MTDNEMDITRGFRVETLSDEQFAGHITVLRAPLAQLHPSNPHYEQIKRTLMFAIDWRIQAADNLRHMSRTKVSVNAKDGEMTDLYKAARLQKLRANMCKAREMFLYAHVASTDGWQAAHEVQ